MFASFEEKGKIFTDVVTKQPIESLIQTSRHLIQGNIHIRPQERLKDEINMDETFLAVTDATVMDMDGKVIYKTNFIAINRSQIIWLMPVADLATTEGSL